MSKLCAYLNYVSGQFVLLPPYSWHDLVEAVTTEIAVPDDRRLEVFPMYIRSCLSVTRKTDSLSR